MHPSVSVILPVRNAQILLPRMVADCVELLPEICDQMEVLIIDDGSQDDTAEVARDLCWIYPQVQFHRTRTQRGEHACTRLGLAMARGEHVLWRDGDCPLWMREFGQLWHLKNDYDVVIARLVQSPALWSATLERIKSIAAGHWPDPRLPRAEAALFLMRRDTALSLSCPPLDLSALFNDMNSLGVRWREIRMARDGSERDAQATAAVPNPAAFAPANPLPTHPISPTIDPSQNMGLPAPSYRVQITQVPSPTGF